MSKLLDLLNDEGKDPSWKLSVNATSIMVMIFLFVFIVSDVFVNNFIGLFGTSMFDKGKLRFTGALLQAISFTVIYIFIIYVFDLTSTE
jgi:hypothetical protein